MRDIINCDDDDDNDDDDDDDDDSYISIYQTGIRHRD